MVRLVYAPPSKTVVYRYVSFQTQWGWVAFACRDELVCRLVFGMANRRVVEGALLDDQPEQRDSQRSSDLLEELQRSLIDYFAGAVGKFNCRVDGSHLSDFGRAVVAQCCRVRPGETISYGELAGKIGKPKSARPVGAIMAANRTPILIPCHRVVSADGSLGGYSAYGGIKTKRRLLIHEATK